MKRMLRAATMLICLSLLPATCLFYVLSHEDYADCDPSNYQDFIREKQYLKCYTCSISENFDVYIFER